MPIANDHVAIVNFCNIKLMLCLLLSNQFKGMSEIDIYIELYACTIGAANSW